MGKRKSARKPGAKKGPQPLDKTFKCLFCSTPDAVTCKIDDKTRIGYLTCKICGQNFSTPATSLTQSVDVYHDWVDACEMVNAE